MHCIGVEQGNPERYGSRLMSQIAAAQQHGGWAVFLDVDGTILEIAETPQDVYVPESLKILLNALCLRLDGALALISGRSIADLDRLFAPFRFCVAGVHGSEQREPTGCVMGGRIDASALDGARNELFRLVDAFPGLLLEDKQIALALHFRRVPHLLTAVCERMEALAAGLGPQFVLQPGRCVFEIRPAAWTKATAIERFMEQPPFQGRTPIFLGDDLTDEDGFAWVNRKDGLSIRVGAALHTTAKYAFDSVPETQTWLRSIPPVFASRLRRFSEGNTSKGGEGP
jgi:trehalose 6-phosphate phosphatase